MWNSWLHRVSLRHNWQSCLTETGSGLNESWISVNSSFHLLSRFCEAAVRWIGNKVLGVCECVHNERCELFPWTWPPSPAWGHTGWVQLHVCVLYSKVSHRQIWALQAATRSIPRVPHLHRHMDVHTPHLCSCSPTHFPLVFTAAHDLLRDSVGSQQSSVIIQQDQSVLLQPVRFFKNLYPCGDGGCRLHSASPSQTQDSRLLPSVSVFHLNLETKPWELSPDVNKHQHVIPAFTL